MQSSLPFINGLVDPGVIYKVTCTWKRTNHLQSIGASVTDDFQLSVILSHQELPLKLLDLKAASIQALHIFNLSISQLVSSISNSGDHFGIERDQSVRGFHQMVRCGFDLPPKAMHASECCRPSPACSWSSSKVDRPMLKCRNRSECSASVPEGRGEMQNLHLHQPGSLGHPGPGPGTLQGTSWKRA